MIKNYLFVVLIFCSFSMLSFGFDAPLNLSATLTGGQTVCQNSGNVILTFTGIGGTPPYTFNYTINNGTPQTISTNGNNSSVNLNVNTNTAGTFTYVLVSVQDSQPPNNPTSISGVNQIITVNPAPNANLTSSGAELINFQNQSTFRVCSNSPSQIQFFNASQTVDTNSSYTINWGDGSPNFTSNSWETISHTYQVGFWTLTYTITNQFGCNITRIFRVFVGTNPAVGLENPGNTEVCISSPITFQIPGTSNNPPGTTYTVTFNDNTPSTTLTFNHPPPSSVTHTFLNSSCGTSSSSGGNTFQNSFFASIIAINPCGQSSATVVPVRISTPPVANFNLPQNQICTGVQICLENTSTGGDAASESSCDVPKVVWNITPNTGFTIASGTFGNDFGQSTNSDPWVSGSQIICPVFNTPGVYTIRMRIGNRCGVDEIVKTLCVESVITPQFTVNNDTGCIPFAVSTNNNTNLGNTCSPVTYAWQVNYTAAYCGTSSGFSFTGGTNASSASPSFNFTQPGIYTLSLTTTNVCGSSTTTQTINVLRPPTVELSPLANTCGPGTITPNATVNGCAPTGTALTYNWSFPGGTPSSSNSANPGTIQYTSPGTYSVSLTVSNSCGNSNVVTQSFTITQVPEITNTSLSQTICSGLTITPVTITAIPPGTTFSWTASGTAGVTGFTASGNNATIPAQTIFTSGSTPGQVVYVITPTFNGCQGPTVNYTVIVNPAPTITSQPVSSTVCLGGNPTPMTVSINPLTPGLSYQWFSNITNTNTGGTPISGDTNATFTPPATTVGTIYYYAVISVPGTGCNSLNSNTASVTVEPLPTITTQPTNTQSICVGGVVPALTASYSGGLGTPTYQWFSNTSPSNSGGTAIAGATASSYAPPVFTAAGTFYYYVQITLSGTGCGAIISDVASVVVVADPVIDVQPLPSQTQCQGSPASPLEVTVSGGLGTVSYQWYSNTANNTTSGTPITGATSNTFTPPTTTEDPQFYYVIATQAASGCSVTSATAQVVVVPAPTISVQPLASQTVCLDGATTPLTVDYINGIGTPAFQWFSNSSNSNSGGTAITGATTSSFSPPSNAEGTLYYYVVITFSSGGCTNTTSATAAVTVTPLPAIETQPTNTQSICVGGVVPALTVSYSGGLGTPTYQWFTNTSPSNSGGNPIAGATASSYAPPVFTAAGTFYYYVQITLSGTGCGAIISDVATVLVVADPVIDVQPLPSQTQCQGSPATPLEVTVSGGLGAVSYQWYGNTANNTTSGTPITGATSNTFTPPTTTEGTLFYYVIAMQSVSGCEVISEIAQVEIVPSPLITAHPQDAIVCEGGTLSPLNVVFTNGTGTVTYQWYGSLGPINGATSDSYLPSSLTSGEYYVIITFSSGGCSSITSDSAIVTIVPLPEFDVQPTAIQTVCEGGFVPAFFNVSYSGGTGNATYQWYRNTNQTTTGGTPINGAINSTYTPPVFTTVGSYYFYVEISFDGEGCGSIISALAEVNVIPDPVVIQQPLPNQTVCQNSPATPISVEVAGGIFNDFNYQWFVSSTNSIGSGTAIAGATSNEFTPPTAVAGTFFYYSLITQTEASGCSVFSEIAIVIINLAPEVTNQPESNTYCLGDTPQTLTFSIINGIGTPNIQWYSNSSATNTGGVEISGATAADFVPPTNQVGIFNYYVVINFPSLAGDCSAIVTEVATIIVNQVPVINNEAITICSDNPFEVNPQNQLPNIIPPGTVYTWSVISILPTGAVTGASNNLNPVASIGQFLINTTTNPAVVLYEVTPTSGDCIGQAFQVAVTVNPAISPNVTVNNSTCYQIDNGSITTNIVGGIPPYVITWTGPDGFVAATPSITNLAPGTYTLLIEDTGDCPYTESFTITEPDDIVITTIQAVDITCFGFDNGFIEILVSGGTPPFNYTWTKSNVFYSNEQNLSNLGPGTYEVSVSDINNCGPKTATFTIIQPPLLEVSLVSQTNVECFGDATGAIEVLATGGTITSSYSFLWTGPNGFNSTAQNLESLIAGSYLLTVTDVNQCVATLTVVLTTSPEIIISYTTTPISCYGANDASLSVVLSGGVSPFQFTWNNLSTSLNQNNLSAGDYIITVTDAFGCVRMATITIPEAPVFMVNPIVNQITCFGANNGSINLNLTGGIPPVTLSWSDGSTAGLIRNNLPPGTYTATISDGTPCFIVRTFTIIEPQALVISAALTQPTDCLNAASGAINLIVSGGTPPFSYQWSNGTTTEDLVGVVAGNYGVTVTDANGCTKSGQFTLIRPNPLTVAVTTQTDANCETREVIQYFIAQASGGVPPYNYQWSSGNVSGANNQIMQTSLNGMVILSVTDALGCSIEFNVNVENPIIGNPNIAAESFGYLTYGIYSINDPIQFYGNVTGDYLNVVWDFGDGTFSNELNPIHTYTLEREYIVTMTVTYPFGCVYVLTISLLVEKGYLLVIPSAFTPNNDGLNDTFRPVSKYLKNLRMDVYDSWGSMIFSESGEVLVGWDGMIKGINAENGNYYSVITAETFYGAIIQQNQTFVLIK